MELGVPESHSAKVRKESMSCEVVVSIENVSKSMFSFCSVITACDPIQISIHQVRALGEQGQERALLGKGTLRILRCQSVTLPNSY